MTVINIFNARKNLHQIISKVNKTNSPVTILNNSGKNAVIISEKDWKSIQETLYLNSIPGMAESIIQADKEPLSNYSDYYPDEEW